MAQLTVRDVPPDVLAMLRSEAEERHASLNAVVCAALEEHAERMRRRKLMERLLPRMEALSDEILAAHGGQPTSDSASLLREDRGR